VGKDVEARVLNLNFVDGCINVSLDPKVIARTIFSVRDIQPGMMVTGDVLAVLDAGVLVQLADNIKALIPTAHLGDTTVSRPTKQFPVGKSVSCRVLAISKKQRVTLTCKKTLLKPSLSVIDSFEKAVAGLITYGVVTQVKDYGCKIQFFGHVQGILPIRDIKRSSGLEQGQVPSDVFSEGQLVNVRVVSADAEKRKLQLSMSLVEIAKPIDDPNMLRAGRIVSGTVTGAINDDEDSDDEEEEEEAEGDEGEEKKEKTEKAPKKKYLIITLDGFEGVTGKLEAAHLTDHPQLASSLYKTYAEGDKIEKILVLWTNKDGKPTLSAKPSLIAAAGTEALPGDMKRIQEGSILHGYVRTVTSIGVFVGFLRSVAGLAPRSMLSDHFVSNPSDHFHPGQSVRACVQTVDLEEKKLTVSLRPSAVKGAQGEDAGFVASFVVDRARIQDKREKEGVKWSKYAVGSKVPFTVTHIQPTFVVGTLEEGVNTLAMRPHHAGEEGSHEVMTLLTLLTLRTLLNLRSFSLVTSHLLPPCLFSPSILSPSLPCSLSSLCVGGQVHAVPCARCGPRQGHRGRDVCAGPAGGGARGPRQGHQEAQGQGGCRAGGGHAGGGDERGGDPAVGKGPVPGDDAPRARARHGHRHHERFQPETQPALGLQAGLQDAGAGDGTAL
jgi:rRNA biogenesis protein RRP5